MGLYVMPDNVRDIWQERLRQDDLKAAGKFAHTCADIELVNTDRLAVLVEEVGEVATAVMNMNGLAFDEGKAALRKELVQVAAVCLAWLDGLDKPNVY